MSNYCVYIHKNKINGKRYVGITSQNPERRWRSGNGYCLNEHFYRAICKYGWDNFTHEILASELTKQDACNLEKELIAFYKSNDEKYGYNKSSGGENPCEGAVFSQETRKKMSDARRGIVFSEEQKKNMSIAAKKRGNGRTGKRGKDCGKSGIVRQIDIGSGEIIAEYYGFYEMERETGFSVTPVKRATRGKQKQSFGYKWEYIPRRATNVVV